MPWFHRKNGSQATEDAQRWVACASLDLGYIGSINVRIKCKCFLRQANTASQCFDIVGKYGLGGLQIGSHPRRMETTRVSIHGI